MSEQTTTNRFRAGSLAVVIAIVAATLGALKLSGRFRAHSREPVSTVRLGYFANLSHAQAVLGISSGEFASAVAPAKLTTKVFNAGPTLIEALFAGEIDIGYVGPGPALAAQARSKGEGIRVIAGAASNGVVIVARRDSGIRTLADLAGRRVATPQHGNTQDISARHYLTATLGQKDLGNVLPIPNAEQSGMMERGQIDAAWAPEPWGARLISETGATLVAQEKDLWPGGQFALAVVVTTPEFLEDHPDVVEKVLGVHHAWTLRLQANSAAYASQLGSALQALTGKKLPPGVIEAALARVQFTDDPLEATFKTMAQWTYDLDFERTPVRTARLFDLKVLEKVRAAAPATREASHVSR